MSSNFARTVLRLCRTFATTLVLSLGAASVVAGPARLHETASRVLAKVARTVHGSIAVSELIAVEDQIVGDRQVLTAASTQRDEVFLRVKKLIDLRNGLISRKEMLRESRVPVTQALHQASGEDLVHVNGGAYRRNDVGLRMLSLEMQEVSIDQEIAETERVIAQLMSEFGDLDHQIAQAKDRLDARERGLLLARYHLEGEVAGTDVLESLHLLDRSNGGR